MGTYDLLSAGKFAELVNKRESILGNNPIYSDDEVQKYKQNGGTDWQDEIFRSAVGHNHQLDISGGSENTTYFISANYLNQEGIIKNSDYKRYSLRANVSTKITDKLSFKLNTSLNSATNKNTNLLSGTANPLAQALVWAPTTSVYNDDGSYVASDPVGSVFFNPVALLYEHENLIKKSHENIMVSARYEFIDGMSLKVSFAADQLNQRNKVFNNGVVANGNPTSSQNTVKARTIQETNTLTYQHDFNGGHSLSAVAVFETQKYNNDAFNANATGLLIPALKYDNLSLSNSQTISSGLSSWSLLSLLGRINYSYKEKYLITASVRRDGSSKFRKSNHFSTFPAVGVGWNMTNEKFIQNSNLFSHLKLRASWGLTGSQAIAPFATRSTYSPTVVSFNGGGLTNGIMLGNPGNPDLKWETTEQTDVGIEAGILGGRVHFSADYFIKNTRDLLLNKPLPGYVGGGTYTVNAGKIRNKGWDFAVGGDILNSPSMTWSSNFNISIVHNKVRNLGGQDILHFKGLNVGAGLSPQSEFVVKKGNSLGAYWGLKYLGTWKPDQASEAAKYGAKPGDSRYEDLNGDHSIKGDDYQIIGYGMPTTSLGWNNTLTYKQFTLNFFFQGILGYDKMDFSMASGMIGGADARQITMAKILDRYIPKENETSNIPAFSSTNVVHPQSSRFLQDGSFIRLKNISIAYKLPLRVFNRKSSLRFMLSAQNLFTITDYTGIDPEASNNGSDSDADQGFDYGAYPNSKSVTFGVKLNF